MSSGDTARHRVGMSCGRRRVFIIAEDDIDRSVLQFMLVGDHDAQEFESIDAAESHRHWPANLVIVAATVVASSGPHLIARWRLLWPEMKIVVICEACGDDSVLAALHAGADDTLTRPLHMNLVCEKVEQVLDVMPAFAQPIPLADAPQRTPTRKL